MTDWLADFESHRRRRRGKRLAFNDAVDAVRTTSAGRTKAEVEEMLAAELRRTGQTPPSATALSYLADRVLAGQDVASQVRLHVRGAELAVNTVRDTVRAIQDFYRLTRPVSLDDDPLFIRFDRSRPPADVILDPGAQQLLSPPPGIRVPEHLEVFVILKQDVEGGEVSIHFEEGPLGMLSSADGTDFDFHLAAGRAQGRPVVSEALQDMSSDGSWALHVYRPLAETDQPWLRSI